MYSNNSYNIFTKSTVNKSTITVDTCTLHRQRHEVTAYTQQSPSVDRPDVEIGPDVEQISLDALVIRASAAIDNHICSVSSGTYELVLGTSWLGYELAWYDLVRLG